MRDNTHCFMLRRTDPATGSAVAETRVFIGDLARLRDVLGVDDDPNLDQEYILEDGDVAAIGALCDPPADLDPKLDTIGRWHPICDVPYLVHTNFELPLMLEKRKPMAVFSAALPAEWLAETMERFAPHVQEGRITLRVFDEPAKSPPPNRSKEAITLRRVFYALPGEEWRIEAYLDLWRGDGWSSSHERREGELLGYEDWQNDWWAEHRQRMNEVPASD